MSSPRFAEPGRPAGVAVLGSTGSIGRQTVDVLERLPDRFRVVALAADKRRDVIEEQARRLRPSIVAMRDPSAAAALDLPAGTEISGDPDALVALARRDDVDFVIVGTGGIVSLRPVIAALEAGKVVATANKETLVAGGHLVMPLARALAATVARDRPLDPYASPLAWLRPIDSEHSAIWQCLVGEAMTGVASLLLTASGGPFLDAPTDLSDVLPEQALQHPTWSMGSKITIDSATLANKGLEVIEAHWLYDVAYDEIEVVIHPQSVVHSAVRFVDGSLKAQLGTPDMRLPIQYALTFPERHASPSTAVDLVSAGRLDFRAPDEDRFPALRIAREAGRIGQRATTSLIAADEVAVAQFLDGSLPFTGNPGSARGGGHALRRGSSPAARCRRARCPRCGRPGSLRMNVSDIFQALVTTFLFFLILGVLVLVHELGHFVTARLAGVRVLEFGIGFPPRAKILRAKGETLYTLNWLPIGGFVKLEGEDGDATDDPRSFARARLPTRLIILAAGVFMNLVTALAIFTMIAWLATPLVGVRFGEVQQDSPAAAAGLVSGETILAVDGQQYEFFGSAQVLTDIRSKVGQTVVLTVEGVDGQRREESVRLRTQSEIDASVDENGIAQKGALGISAFNAHYYGPYVGRDLPTAIGIGVSETGRWFGLILGGLGDLVSGFIDNPTAPPAVQGPVGIATAIGDVFFGAGAILTLYVAAILSANLALVNALPFPPLDGGRFVIILLKSIFGQRISLRAERLTYVVGFVFLFAFLIWVTGFDLIRILGGGT